MRVIDVAERSFIPPSFIGKMFLHKPSFAENVIKGLAPLMLGKGDWTLWLEYAMDFLKAQVSDIRFEIDMSFFDMTIGAKAFYAGIFFWDDVVISARPDCTVLAPIICELLTTDISISSLVDRLLDGLITYAQTDNDQAMCVGSALGIAEVDLDALIAAGQPKAGQLQRILNLLSNSSADE
jgi:hypothetical protein